MALPSTVSRSNWNLEMLVFVEGGKPEYPEKNPPSRDKNQQQTQPTHDAERRDRESNPGHIGGRRVLSPLRHPCSHIYLIPSIYLIVELIFENSQFGFKVLCFSTRLVVKFKTVKVSVWQKT